MASPNSTFTEMVTTTFRNHPSKISDNVSDHNALYRRLKKKGRVTKEGGYEIVEPLDYAENSTYQRYSGYDRLNIQQSDVLTAAKYDWVQAAINVVASGRELRMNRGKEQIIKLVKARMDNAMRTAANNMSVDMYSSGSLTNQMGGLAHLIQTNGQGTVGGINSATYSFWRNQFNEATGTLTASTVRGEMNELDLLCTRGADRVDLIIATHDAYTLYWNSLTDLQRYSDTTEAGANFQTLKFKNSDVMFDSNDNFSTTGMKMYFLNTDYLKLVEHPDAKWTPVPKKTSVDQDAEVVPIIWMGQMCCSNRSLQGVLIDES